MIESTENFSVGRFRVRVWRDEERLLPIYDNADVLNAARAFVFAHSAVPTEVLSLDLVRCLLELPRVSAAEVQIRISPFDLDIAPISGVVVYQEWP